uniref:Exonuclease domain-containing protein n=1 Tax=Trichogramma kaykai TaxID=54128 RepID=A0ABD2W8P8_9HYME
MGGAPATKKPKLEGKAFLELKERLKQQKKVKKNIPRLRLLPAGVNASLSIDNEDRTPIILSDIQNLLMYSVSDLQVPLRWCKVEKFTKVSHAVVLIVDGLNFNHYKTNQKLLDTLKSDMEHKLELITPAINVQRKRKHSETEIPKTEDLPDGDKFSRTELLLSSQQMVENGYPLPIKGGSDELKGYKFTKDKYAEVNSKSRMFGLDCEMCMTDKNRSELTRVSIVDESLEVIYDTFVKPYNKITNYLTRFSGITKELLEDVTTRLEDVQEHIKKILPDDAILIGQSLNFDLRALEMMHPYVIDTSVIFNLSGIKGRKAGLKVLTQAFLKESIQNAGKDGHCSVEDSRAAIKLVQLKLLNTPTFGDGLLISQSELQEQINKGRSKPFTEQILASLIFQHMNKVELKSAALAASPSIMNEYSKALVKSDLKIMDDDNFQQSDFLRLVIKDTNKKTVKRFSEVITNHALNFCHVRLTEDEVNEENIGKTLKSVNKWIKNVWDQVENHGFVCVIFSGTKDVENGACFLSIKKNDNIEQLKS